MLSTVKQTAKKLYTLYIKRPKAAIEFSSPMWRFLNRKPRTLYTKKPPTLNVVQERIVSEMKENGFATAHIDEIFPEQPELFQSMLKTVETLLPNAKQDPKKIHFKALWDTRSFLLDRKSPFVQFALSPQIINITNAYMGMWSRLLLCNGYLSEPNPDRQQRVQTQNWHRDAHDKQLMSIFIYLTDVTDEGDGPLWYVKKSHVLGTLRSLFPQPKPHSTKKFPTGTIVDETIQEEDKIMCVGKKGTIIFTDGTGIHRGGHSTTNPRAMILTAYTSNHRFSKNDRLSYPDNLKELLFELHPEARYAINLEKGKLKKKKNKQDSSLDY